MSLPDHTSSPPPELRVNHPRARGHTERPFLSSSPEGRPLRAPHQHPRAVSMSIPPSHLSSSPSSSFSDPSLPRRRDLLGKAPQQANPSSNPSRLPPLVALSSGSSPHHSMHLHIERNHPEISDSPSHPPPSTTTTTSSTFKSSPTPPSRHQRNSSVDSYDSDVNDTLEEFARKSFNFFSKAKDRVVPAAQKAFRIVANEPAPEVDDHVRRDHWQHVPDGYDALCTLPSCDRTLDGRNGRFHCRLCGKLYCELHCACEMKLTPDAHHDPVLGAWSRVCDRCHRSQEGYDNREGQSRTWTQDLLRYRRTSSQRANLLANCLEKRLDTLTKVYAGDLDMGQSSLFRSPAQAKKAAEQMIVSWEEDQSTDECPLCSETFSALRNRRHHCRLCGRVVCGKPTCTQPLTLIPNVTSIPNDKLPPTEDQAPVGMVRVCHECRRVVVQKREKEKDKYRKPPAIVIHYKSLRDFQDHIDHILPKFERLLFSLDPSQCGKWTHEDIEHVGSLRDEIFHALGKYDAISKKIGRLDARTASATRLYMAIRLSAQNYLRSRMVSSSEGGGGGGGGRTIPSSHLVSRRASAPIPANSSSLSPMSSTTKVPSTVRTYHQTHGEISSSLFSSSPISPVISSGSTVPSLTSSNSSPMVVQGGISHDTIPSPSLPTTTTTSSSSSTSTPPPDLIVKEAAELRTHLSVLREQYSQLESLLQQASQDRRLDDVSSLKAGLEDLDGEMERTRIQLSTI
ncbi:MAG: FYVE zinc finger-domain-containing protein [Piptocephalis tieghemiana]|nr:MAG: FYVE zinc finger-domain-containing protein [Piptocephalis tieghemiana]